MRARHLHGLKRQRIRQSWNKHNLYNLSQLPRYSTAETLHTLFQQKWNAKSVTRAYHGEHVSEKQWERIFQPRMASVVPMDHVSLARWDGSRQAAGRGSGEERPTARRSLETTPYMPMLYAPLERRLDTAVFRAMFASSTRQARQFVVHGNVRVNGKKMTYPGYLLNPGDMFQVDPDRVLFATGAPKDRSDRVFARRWQRDMKKSAGSGSDGPTGNEAVATGQDDDPEQVSINENNEIVVQDSDDDDVDDDNDGEEEDDDEEGDDDDEDDDDDDEEEEDDDDDEGDDDEDDGEDAEEGDDSIRAGKEKRPVMPSTKGRRPASATAQLVQLVQRARAVLDDTKTKLSAKRKQTLRGFQREVRRAMSRQGRYAPADARAATASDLEAQLDAIIAAIYSPSSSSPAASSSPSSSSAQEPSSSSSSPASAAAAAASRAPRLSAEDRRSLTLALQQAQENPFDPTKPYGTPWRPRDYMSAFAFIPRFLEVNQNICSAVYLRHPVARPGNAEVPSPFSFSDHQLAFTWYLRRR